MISEETVDPKLFNSMKLPSLFIIITKTSVREQLHNVQDCMQNKNVWPSLKNFKNVKIATVEY